MIQFDAYFTTGHAKLGFFSKNVDNH